MNIDGSLISHAVSGRGAKPSVVEAEAPDTVRFTRAIKDVVPYEERIAVIEALWQVALADGEKSPFEDAFIRRISPLLAIGDRERVFARSRAEARMRPR